METYLANGNLFHSSSIIAVFHHVSPPSLECPPDQVVAEVFERHLWHGQQSFLLEIDTLLSCHH